MQTSSLGPSKPQVMEVILNAPTKAEQKSVEAVSVESKAVEKRINELKKQEADKKVQETLSNLVASNTNK